MGYDIKWGFVNGYGFPDARRNRNMVIFSLVAISSANSCYKQSEATFVWRKVKSKIPVTNVACDGFAYGFENFGSCLSLSNMFCWGLQR